MKGGWTFIIGSPKWHYIVDHRSLCGRWLMLGSPKLEQGLNNSPDNCKECRKRLLKTLPKEDQEERGGAK
jgi:hypothetical protein